MLKLKLKFKIWANSIIIFFGGVDFLLLLLLLLLLFLLYINISSGVQSISYNFISL